MRYDECIKEAANELNLPLDYVSKVYKAYWRTIKEHIESIDFKDNLTEEEFNKLRPNINVPYIGKFYVTYKYYENLMKYKGNKERIKNK